MKNYYSLPIIACFLLFTSNVSAQKNIEDKSAAEVFLEGMFLNYDKKYEEAINVYEKVSINDTNYSAAQIEIANCYYVQEDFKSTQDVLVELLSMDLPYSKNNRAYNLLGLAYEKDRKFDKAIEVFDKALKLFPYNSSLYSNRGYTYENAEKYTEAVKNYKRAIQLNPNSAGNHYHLGMLAANDGLYAEAILSLTTFILLENNTERAQKALHTMEQISDLTFDAKPKNIDWEYEPDYFEKLNQSIKDKSSVAQKMKFSIPTPLGDQLYYILRTSHYQKENEGFWNQFYMRFYEEVYKNNKIDGLVMCTLQPTPEEVIAKKLKRKKSKITVFMNWAQVIWETKKEYQFLEVEGKKQHVLVGYNSSGIRACGTYDANDKPIGTWYYFFTNGAMRMMGNYNDENLEQGLWTWYNAYNGKKKNSVHYKNGVANGEAFVYYYSGELNQKRRFRDNELEDTIFNYYRSGDLFEKYAVSGGKKNGAFVDYHENGQLDHSYSYVLGFAQGPYKKYYANGVLSDEFTLMNDKIEGVRKEYYPNGAKRSELNYKEDRLDGVYKVWYSNGNLEIERNYKNGNQVGKFTEYYSNGAKSFDGEVDETGKQNGTCTYYDYDGKKYEEQDFKRGELIEVRSINKKGEVFHHSDKRGKKIDFKAHYPNGVLRVEGLYMDNIRTGEWKYYDRHGNIESIDFYQNGMLSDTATDYFANGAVKTKSIYSYDELNGIYLKYNILDTLIEEGIYIGGIRDRDWYVYNSDGKLKGEYYYNDGRQQGIQKTYGVNEKLSNWKEIELGKIVSQLFLDTNENKIDQYGQFQGEIKLHDPSNTYVRYSGTYKNGLANGKSTWYDIDGSVLVEGNYINGDEDGVWKWYTEDGVLKKEVTFLLGTEHGILKLYHPNGKLSHEANFVSGDRQGIVKDYFSNGNLSVETNFMDSEKHGKSTYYDYSGNVIMNRYYDKGVLVSYSCTDKTGNEITPIQLTKGKNMIVTYFSNGNKASEHTRENGLIEGKYIQYNMNGTILSEEDYFHSLQHGMTKEYNDKGVLEYEGMSKADQLHGLVKWYHPNGKLHIETNYLYDERHGLSKEYSPDGKLIKTIMYYNDDAIKVTPGK